MTVRTATFRWQLDYLKQHHYPIIPLRALISYLRGQGPPPPPRSVVITADDGHESVFTDMLPVVREYHVPVTLFIYPSAISERLVRDDLGAARRSCIARVCSIIQSHTYWHPNFKTEKRRLSPTAYRTFAYDAIRQDRGPCSTDKLGVEADLVAWPFWHL